MGPIGTSSRLRLGGESLRAYGSQGQQRMALLALLFAERRLSSERRGRPPIMLLDDVMSELDSATAAAARRAPARGGTGRDHRHRGRPGARDGDAAGELIRVAGRTIHAPEPGGSGVRRVAPRPLARALEGALRRAEPPTLLARVQASWAAAAGPGLAAAATPVSEREGVVTVACESAVWAQELELLGARSDRPPEREPGPRRGRTRHRPAFRHRFGPEPSLTEH